MMHWFNKLTNRPGPSKPLTIHPSWGAGQYVTYFIERSDGSWTSIGLRVLGKMQDGAWILAADFKTAAGEYTAQMRSDPDLSANSGIDPMPGPIQQVRGTPIQSIADSNHPMNQMTLALNLFTARRAASAMTALQKDSRPVRYACQIEHAFPLASGKFIYDLNPRVLLTGVACLSFDGGKNPITVTSFGCSDPKGYAPGSYDDFVDFSHPMKVDHDGFSLTFPATWFLRLQRQKNDAAGKASYFAAAGGNTCAAALSVTLSRGDPTAIAAERDLLMSRLENLPVQTALRPTPTGLPVLSGDARSFAFDTTDGKTSSFSASAVFRDESMARLVLVGLSGTISRRIHSTMRRLLRCTKCSRKSWQVSSLLEPRNQAALKDFRNV